MFIEAVCLYKTEEFDDPPISISEVYFSPLSAPLFEHEYLLTNNTDVQLFSKNFLVKYKEGNERTVFSLEKVSDGSGVNIGDSNYIIKKQHSKYPATNVFFIDEVFVFLYKANVKKSDFEPAESKSVYRTLVECTDGLVEVDSQQLVSIEPIKSELRRDYTFLLNKYKIIFENYNEQNYTFLIKNLIRDIKLVNHSFVNFYLLHNHDSLYFNVFAVNGYIVAILTRELYNLIPLVNYILRSLENSKDIEPDSSIDKNYDLTEIKTEFVKIVIDPLLNIPLISHSSFFISKNGDDLIHKFTLPKHNIDNILYYVLRDENIVLNLPSVSFWVVMSFLEQIQPLKYAGLILLPVNSDMVYLLNGPYNFIATSSVEIKMKNTRYIEIEKETQEYEKINLCELANIIIDSKLDTNFEFPLFFNYIGSNTEKKFINSGLSDVCDYIYDLNEKLVFIPCADIYKEDPLRLWIIIFPGRLDYASIIKDRSDTLPYLIKRACIDADQENLKNLVNLIRDKKSLKAIASYLDANNIFESYNTNINIDSVLAVDTCTCLRKESILKFQCAIVQEFSIFEYSCNTCKDNCKKCTLLFIEGKLSYLMTIDNILACIDSNYINDQVYINILVYFHVYKLPIEDASEKELGEFNFID